jgi:Ca2+-dependent lipid-binding protein
VNNKNSERRRYRRSDWGEQFTNQSFDVLISELLFYLIILLFGSAIGGIIFACITFGFGALFLILPFAMLIYYAARKYVEKQRMNDSNHELNEI